MVCIKSATFFRKVGTSGKEDSARLSKLDSTLTEVFFEESSFRVEWMSSKLLQAFGGVFFDFWPKTIYRLSKLRFYLSCHTSSGEIVFPGKVNSLVFFSRSRAENVSEFLRKKGFMAKKYRNSCKNCILSFHREFLGKIISSRKKVEYKNIFSFWAEFVDTLSKLLCRFVKGAPLPDELVEEK